MTDMTRAEDKDMAEEMILVPRAELLAWAKAWEDDYGPNDGTDCVTPFDPYLMKAPVETQPVMWQYQDRNGKWHGFIDESHRLNTIKDGRWPIRALYAHPPPSAPVGVGRKYPDDGNGVDDAYNRGWNDCLDALAPQPPAEAQAQGGGEMVAWPDGLLDRVKEAEE